MKKKQYFKNESFLINGLKITVVMFLLAFLCACSSSGTDGGNNSNNNPPVHDDPPGMPAVLFLSDQDTGNGNNELWGVFTDAQGNLSRLKLSQDLTNGGEILEYALDPAYGLVVAYVTDDTADGRQQLWTVEIDGTNRIMVADLTADLNGEGVFTEWHWAPDSCCIVYRADKDGDGLYELYLVDAADITSTERVDAAVPFDVKSGFQWAPDGYYIAFRAWDRDDSIDGTAIIQLYVYDVDTGNVDNVSDISQTDPADPNIVGVQELAWQPELPADYPLSNPFIAYIADDDDEPGENELYRAVLNPGGGWSDIPISINDDTGNDVLDFKWHPKSQYIAYRAEMTNNGQNIVLYTVAPTGLGHDLLSGENYENGQEVEDDYQWAPGDGLFIAYRANERNVNFTELFWAAQDGTGTGGVKVNQTQENIASFQWAPGGLLPSFLYDYIAYRTDSNELKTRPYLGEGGADPENVISGGVGNNDFYGWAPLFEGHDTQNTADWEVTTTTRIAYTSNGNLYTDTPIGTNPLMLSGVDPDEDNASVNSAQWSVEARNLVYRAEDNVDNADALYATLADQQSTGEKISGDITVGGADGVTDYQPVLVSP
jgi:hypothetical protein